MPSRLIPSTSAASPQSPVDTVPASTGPLYRLGVWSGGHARLVVGTWLVLIAGLGVFAPSVESHLSGAGWQANGSDSVKARAIIDRDFGGLSGTALQVVVSSPTVIAETPRARLAISRAEQLLRADPRVATVVPPQSGRTLSRDGRTAVVQGGSGADSTEMVRAADDLSVPLRALSGDGVSVTLTGSSALWSAFNQANLAAMVRSEVLSWPVTLTILLLAFGSLVAAGLPLMLTIAGLGASAGVLSLVGMTTHVSVWAMNFALMFALALGIDYALFVVVRYRTALAERLDASRDGVLSKSDTTAAVGPASESAGKAVLFSGVTVLISLSAVMLVPSPAFRSMAFGIMVAVVFVLAATLTLLPAVLASLGGTVNRFALSFAKPAPGPSRRFIAWARVLERHPWRFGIGAILLLTLLAAPAAGLRTGMPSITVIPETTSARIGFNAVQEAFGPGALNQIQILAPASQSAAARAALNTSRDVALVLPTESSRSGWTLTTVVSTSPPSTRAADAGIERLRAELPAGVLVGGANVENHDLHQVLTDKAPMVLAVVLALGFLLLLLALQAPLIAALGVATNLLAVGAAFGIGRLIFQDGHGASLLAFTPQGFLDAWAPVFFFAMIFAISMDYTVFLLSAAREAWDVTGDPRRRGSPRCRAHPPRAASGAVASGRSDRLVVTGVAAPQLGERFPRSLNRQEKLMDFQRDVTCDLPFAEVVDRVRTELAGQGFGVLTEIDVQATLRSKLGVEIEPHLILGACDPALAHRALQVDPRVGALLPCNVTVSVTAGTTRVRIMDPLVMTAFDGTEALAPIAEAASIRLRRVLARLGEETTPRSDG